MSIFRRRKKIKIKNKGNPNELLIYLRWNSYSGYSTTEKVALTPIPEILKKFYNNADSYDVNIKSEFNDIEYPVFDLDEIDYKNTFTSVFKDKPYVIFKTSVTDECTKYWAILGEPLENGKKNIYWRTCNDPKYVKYTEAKGVFYIRGLYENKIRKPIVVENNGEHSDNFKLYIDKLVDYYNQEALELSVLKYKTPELILKFDRRKKL